MQIEVEQKHAVADLSEVERALKGLQAGPGAEVLQVDTYFAHPARDFAQTDEALRIRSVGDDNFVTYKGPKLDPRTKTRREIELPLEARVAGAARFAELLEALGFRRVAEVRKRRRTAHVAWQGREVEVALDAVERVGTFVELELIVEAVDVPAAQACLASLAKELKLAGSERRSYLELLLESS